MKKLSWTLLALCFMLTLSACGKSNQKQTDVTPEESVQKTTSERESDDPRESASEGTSEKARETTTAPAETTTEAESTEAPAPAFTKENIEPYKKHVTDLAYAVLQRGSDNGLYGSAELSRSEAAARFKLKTDGALFQYCYLNDELLRERTFEGTYDAQNDVRYCLTNQEEIVRTLKALLDLEIGKNDFPESYDSSNCSMCIWNEKGLYLCVPMMGEAPGAKDKDLVLSDGKALLYAEVFEPFNNVPTDELVITLIPAENELGFTIESISLNPNDAADTAWEDGIYSLWEALQEVSELKFKGGNNLDALEVDYQAGQEVTATLKSSGRYIKFTKDYIETTFALAFINSADERVLYNQTGEILRVPVSPALVNTSWESLGDYFAFCKWVFSEAACELFHMDVKDGIVTNIYTQS